MRTKINFVPLPCLNEPPVSEPLRLSIIDPRLIANPDGILSEPETALWLRLSVRNLQRGRIEGRGAAPPFISFGRRIGYRVADVKAWLALRTFASTSAVTVSKSKAGAR